VPETVTGLPKAVPLTKNCTVPVGSCEGFAIAMLCVETTAVNRTAWPEEAVVKFDVTDIVVAAWVTVTVGAVVALAPKLLSPG